MSFRQAVSAFIVAASAPAAAQVTWYASNDCSGSGVLAASAHEIPLSAQSYMEEGGDTCIEVVVAIGHPEDYTFLLNLRFSYHYNSSHDIGVYTSATRVYMITPPAQDQGEDGEEDDDAAVPTFKVAKCSRRLDLPDWLARRLSRHPNVLIEKTVGPFGQVTETLDRGFFPVDGDEAVRNARAFIYFGEVNYTPGIVKQDLVSLGTCAPEVSVTEQRYEDVKQKMQTTNWTEYHAFRRNSIMWAAAVLGY